MIKRKQVIFSTSDSLLVKRAKSLENFCCRTLQMQFGDSIKYQEMDVQIQTFTYK